MIRKNHCRMEHYEKTHNMKEILGYENLYSISENGNIFSHKNSKFLKPIKQTTGYLTVNLYKDKKLKIFTLHRLIAMTFISNPHNKPMVNHKDLNKCNNSIDNLEWVTAKENIQHACDNGIRCGSKNGNSKLNENQIKEIREKYKFRKYTYKMLSDEYGVMKHYIGRIINYNVWRTI